MKKILFILLIMIMCIGCSEQSTANTQYYNVQRVYSRNNDTLGIYCIQGHLFVTKGQGITQFFETTINGEVRPKLCY